MNKAIETVMSVDGRAWKMLRRLRAQERRCERCGRRALGPAFFVVSCDAASGRAALEHSARGGANGPRIACLLTRIDVWHTWNGGGTV